MKLRTSITLAAALLVACVGAAVVCGRRAYRIGYGSVGNVTLPETGVEPLEVTPGAVFVEGARAIVPEAEIIRRVNGLTNYSSYGPPGGENSGEGGGESSSGS